MTDIEQHVLGGLGVVLGICGTIGAAGFGAMTIDAIRWRMAVPCSRPAGVLRSAVLTAVALALLVAGSVVLAEVLGGK